MRKILYYVGSILVLIMLLTITALAGDVVDSGYCGGEGLYNRLNQSY